MEQDQSQLGSFIICSFDPSSYKNLGFAIGVATGMPGPVSLELGAGTCVLSGSSSYPWHSLWPLFQIIEHMIEENEPDLVIVEKTSSFAGGFITGQVSNCLGVILACCGKFNIPVEFVYPTHVKKVIAGKGKATKTEMKKSVIRCLNKLNCQNVKFDSEHAYDAVANILTYLHEADNLEFKIDPPEDV